MLSERRFWFSRRESQTGIAVSGPYRWKTRDLRTRVDRRRALLRAGHVWPSLSQDLPYRGKVLVADLPSSRRAWSPPDCGLRGRDAELTAHG